MLKISLPTLAAVLAAGLLVTPAAAGAPPAIGLPKDACAAMKQHMTEKPAAPAGPNRPLSADSKEVLGKIATLGKGNNNGSAAPNAQAQAMLNMMGAMFASRSDIPAQSSAEYMRMMGAKPGANVAADMKALGC